MHCLHPVLSCYSCARYMCATTYCAGEGGQTGNAGANRPQAQAIELICKCDEIPDDKVELQILKNLLTATTSTTFTVHGQVGRGLVGWDGGGAARKGVL